LFCATGSGILFHNTAKAKLVPHGRKIGKKNEMAVDIVVASVGIIGRALSVKCAPE